MDASINAMMAQHSSKGTLQSGGTLQAAIRIFGVHSSTAVSQTLDEAGKLIDHRGAAWGEAMDAISTAIDDHMSRAPTLLERPLKIAARLQNEGIRRRLEELLSEQGDELRHKVAEFRDGFTAPIPTAWKDRHPTWHTILIGLIGAVLGSLATKGIENTWEHYFGANNAVSAQGVANQPRDLPVKTH